MRVRVALKLALFLSLSGGSYAGERDQERLLLPAHRIRRLSRIGPKT